MGKQKGSTAEAPSMQPQFEQVPFARLRPWLHNPNEGDVEGIMESLEAFGWGRPIVANRHAGLEGEIIIGHHTLEAAQRLEARGVTIRNAVPGHAPVVWTSLPAKKAHGLSLADNQRAKRSKVSDDKLGRVVGLGELDPEEWLGAGFSEKHIKALMFPAWRPAASASDPKIEQHFSVIIECTSEAEQVRVLEWCQAEELRCRALI